jgi:hypothetical protein
MVRRSFDDFEALMTAQGMENAGATVVSIVFDPTVKSITYGKRDGMWYVFSRYADPVTPDAVDVCIEAALDATAAGGGR